jgi:hypothetical protein
MQRTKLLFKLGYAHKIFEQLSKALNSETKPVNKHLLERSIRCNSIAEWRS